MLLEDVSLLIEAYQRLKESITRFEETCASGASDVLLPDLTGQQRTNASLAVSSITRIWKESESVLEPITGLILCDEATVEAAMDMNAEKDRFKETIVSLRKEFESRKSDLWSLIDQTVHNYSTQPSHFQRAAELKEALRIAGIGRLDLTRCYRKVRILPENTESISWTWAKHHSSIQTITRDEVLRLIDDMPDGEVKSTAYSVIAGISSTNQLVKKKNLPDQLRANITFYEQGVRKRKSLTISGVCLVPGDRMPKFVWRERKDSAGERLTRSDRRIDAVPLIKALGIHLLGD